MTIVLAWTALCVLAWVYQDRLIFYPGPPPASTPQSVGLEFETVSMSAADGVQLHGWWIPASNATRAVLVCHGNAGSVEGRLDLAALFHAWGWSTLLFDYRGYGSSAGHPSVAGVALDADAAYDWLAARAPGLPIIAWGESLGGGVAAGLSLRRTVAALVLESTFSSLAAVGRGAYPFLPVATILKRDLDTRAAVSQTTAPVFILHGKQDATVPFAHSKLLIEAARGRKEHCEFQGGHNGRGWAGDPAAVEKLRRFLAQ